MSMVRYSANGGASGTGIGTGNSSFNVSPGSVGCFSATKES